MPALSAPIRWVHPAADRVAVDRVRALGGLDLVEAQFLARSTHLHSHEEVEIGVIVSGERLVSCQGRRVRVGAPSILVFRPGEFHAGGPAGSAGSTYRSFLVRAETLEAACGWTGPGWLAAPVVDNPELARELVAVHRAIGADPNGPAAERLRTALTDLGRRYRRAEVIATEQSEAVRRVRAYLETRYATKVRLATLAELAGLSVFHLIRSFRAAIGLPPYAYLEQVRVNRAIQLLRDGYPVSRVAFLTGFADQSHLTRFFKRLTGVPPGQYQRSARGAA